MIYTDSTLIEIGSKFEIEQLRTVLKKHIQLININLFDVFIFLDEMFLTKRQIK